MRSRYSGPHDTLSLATRVRHFEGSVPAGQVGSLDLLPAEPGERGVAGSWRTRLTRRIAQSGYAFARSGGPDLTGAFEAWEYPPLEAELASHFASGLFGERNSLSLVRTAVGELIVGFCARADLRRQPSIEGQLVLNPDTTLAEAQFRFRTPSPSEDAGGRVQFLPPSRHPEGVFLLPARGVYYLRKSLNYFEKLDDYVDWKTAPSRVRPDL
jgi:hypothetical protein